MKTTVVITGDLHGDCVFNALQKPKIRIRTDEHFDCIFQIDAERECFRIQQGSDVLNVLEVGNVFVRRPLPEEVAKGVPEHSKNFILSEKAEVLSAVMAFSNFSNGRVVFNAGKPYNLARNKIYQLHTAKTIGLDIPPSCVTNQASVANAFYKSQDKSVIYKCLSRPVIHYSDGRRSMIHTSKVTSDDFSNVTTCPCLFQKNIDKAYELRVAVVGNDVTVVRIDSQSFEETKQDWRKGMDNKLLYSVGVLPDPVKQKLIALNHHLQISWSMIDVIVDSSGKHIFLEANPDGAWLWLEDFVDGLGITEKIARQISCFNLPS
jgi:glutathione synthase/RimK-type ligase-like ATP-grasp enzyme